MKKINIESIVNEALNKLREEEAPTTLTPEQKTTINNIIAAANALTEEKQTIDEFIKKLTDVISKSGKGVLTAAMVATLIASMTSCSRFSRGISVDRAAQGGARCGQWLR